MLTDEEVQRHCRKIVSALHPIEAMIEDGVLPAAIDDIIADALTRIESELELMGYDDEAGAAELLQEREDAEPKDGKQ